MVRLELCVLIWTSFLVSAAVAGRLDRAHEAFDGLSSGPVTWADSGNGPWPQPQQLITNEDFMTIDPAKFKFVTKETKLEECEVLQKAIDRYSTLTFLGDCSQVTRTPGTPFRTVQGRPLDNRTIPKSRGDGQFVGQLTNLTIQVRHKCETWPTATMDEMYTLRVSTDDFPGAAFLFANSVWGAIRGLETFSQLVYPSGQPDAFYFINSTFILDYPRFAHRGILLDTSRHYLPVNSLLSNLEAMEYNKMNVFHWHIVDDQSFPFVSSAFPDLSAKGAFYPSHIYTPNDVAQVIDFARLRGIRVMAEFDTPGHTLSWGKGQDDLLTPCYDLKTKNPTGTFGPVDPSQETAFKFMQSFFAEVSKVFPEQYIHLGGDEVDFSCWASNPKIADFMKDKNIKSYEKLEEYYMQRVVDIIGGLNRSYIVWQEVFDNGVELKQDTVVHVWKDPPKWQEEMYNVTAAGYQVLLSTPWYLNYINYGIDWPAYYKADPQDFNGTQEQKNKVMGGEVCMWGEYVDGSNVISRTWPRTSAPAERLWSSVDAKNWHEAAPRLEEQRCRMQRRGIRVEPVNGPGSCPCDFKLV